MPKLSIFIEVLTEGVAIRAGKTPIVNLWLGAWGFC